MVVGRAAVGRVIILGMSLALVLFGTNPVWGQAKKATVETAPPPLAVGPPEVTPGDSSREATQAREADFRPDNIRVLHDPVFIAPFTKTIPTGCDSAIRFGLSGWTAPPGRGDRVVAREATGWLALGVSVAWAGPPEPNTHAGSRAARCSP